MSAMSRLLSVLGALALLLLVGVRPAAADHEQYAVMENAYKYDDDYVFAPQSANWVMRQWWQRTHVTWYAPTTHYPRYSGDLRTHAMASIYAFGQLDGGALGRLTWLETSTAGAAAVEFKWGPTQDCWPEAQGWEGIEGCTFPFWDYYPFEDAWYMIGADVIVTDAGQSRSPNGLRATVAHEIGHVYGLAENYAHDGAHPGSSQSIMNSSVMTGPTGAWGPSSPGSNCGEWPGQALETVCIMGVYYPGGPGWTLLIAPTAEDAALLKAYWRGDPAWYSGYPHTRHNGVTQAYVLHRYGGYSVALTYLDYAWAEKTANVWIEKQQPDGSWGVATQSWLTSNGLGRHYDYADNDHRVHWIDYDLTPHGPGNYRFCAVPIFQAASPSLGGEFGLATTCGWVQAFP
jgi:hypothetical protein